MKADIKGGCEMVVYILLHVAAEVLQSRVVWAVLVAALAFALTGCIAKRAAREYDRQMAAESARYLGGSWE